MKLCGRQPPNLEKKMMTDDTTKTEQTYFENYYGRDLHLFNRNETPSGTDADEQHVESAEG